MKTSPWMVVDPACITCAIDRALIREEICCPCGCEADKTREYYRPFKKNQALLPNKVTETVMVQLDGGV